MRGNPWQQLVLIVVAFLSLGVPVWRLTHSSSATPSLTAAGGTAEAGSTPQVIPSSQGVALDVTMDFAPAAAEFSLSYLDQTVLQGKAVGSAAGKWQAILPSEGADLVLHVTWPPDADKAGDRQGAVRVNVRFPDGHVVERSFWSPEAVDLDAVVTIPAKGT